MKRTGSFILFATVLLIGLASCASQSEEQNGIDQATQQISQRSADMLPAFKMKDVNGNLVDMASLKGKKVFVNLWATWCPPCKAEIPSIEALNAKLDKGKVAFVMLSLDENFELAKTFATENKMRLPIYYATEAVPAVFKTHGIPATFIFNEKGELVKTNNGADDYDTEVYYKLLSL